MENTGKKQSNSKLDLLMAVEKIADYAIDSQLSAEFYRKAGRYIKYIGDRLGLTKEQSVMMALFVDQSDDTSIQAHDIARATGCRTTRVLRYLNDVDELVKKGLVARRTSSGRTTYMVPLDVLEAFKANKAYEPKEVTGLTCQELFDEIAAVMDKVHDRDLEPKDAHEKLRFLLVSNPQLGFVQKMKQISTESLYGEADNVLLLMFCHFFVNDNDDMIGFHDFEDMFNPPTMRAIRREMEQGNHALQEAKLIEFQNNEGMGDRRYFHLTMKAKRDLLDELQLPSLEEKKTMRNVIKSDDIKPRNLFYSKEIDHSIDDLARLLEEENYQSIHSRLQKEGFRCGFTCLFYGAPGTGKTETARQLARRTGRDVMEVNFAELKSCWVGKSEKNVKALFDTYREHVKTMKKTPILLFNEADAIIGKRQVGAERAVDKMENSIQNIILQEMETLDGILIATTNLAENMDKAFERRFLYKIRFDNPTLEARVAIWQEQLPSLAKGEARKLAERYEFSGGQIENIARHYNIDAILHGLSKPTAENLAAHCDSERISQKPEGKKIGFAR